MKSNIAKVGAVSIGSTGILALVLNLHAGVTARLDNEISNRKEYVELVLKPMQTEISNLEKETRETKLLVRDIHSYLLNKNK